MKRPDNSIIKFFIFTFITSVSAGLVTYFNSATDENTPRSPDDPAQFSDILNLKPTSLAAMDKVLDYSNSTDQSREKVDNLPPAPISKKANSKQSNDNNNRLNNSILMADSNNKETVSINSPMESSLRKENIPIVSQTQKVQSAEEGIPAKLVPASPAPHTTALQDRQVETIPTAELKISIAALSELAKKDPRAAYDLSLRYFRGDGVRQDSYQALQTMRDAAERGVLEAQKAIGRLYMTGLEEMGSDLSEAQKWLAIAASRGDKEAAELLEKVTSGRANEDEFYKISRSTHPLTYRHWYYDSPYNLYWRNGSWCYYK